MSGSFCANNNTRPPGRAMFSAIGTSFGSGTANKTASAPMFPRKRRISAAGSFAAGSTDSVAPKRKLICRLNGNGSLVSTVAPTSRAKNVSKSPIGPCPITKTTSSRTIRALWMAFRHVFTGSTKVASSNATPFGMRTIPRSTIHGITRTYCAKPPPFASNPAVTPTRLY